MLVLLMDSPVHTDHNDNLRQFRQRRKSRCTRESCDPTICYYYFFSYLKPKHRNHKCPNSTQEILNPLSVTKPPVKQAESVCSDCKANSKTGLNTRVTSSTVSLMSTWWRWSPCYKKISNTALKTAMCLPVTQNVQV